MASRTIHSNQITFIDTTDDRRLEVHITSNLPTSQIYNPNTLEYTPDWSVVNLQLSADIYLDSAEVTDNSVTSIKWYRRIGTGSKTYITDTPSITVSSNVLSGNNTIITYFCEAEYQGITAQSQISFSRVDTGLNGETGADGTSVTIKGTAYVSGVLSVGSTVILYSDSNYQTPISTTNLSSGDAYLVDGYLCVYNEDSGVFICVGTIRGPSGRDGKDATFISLNSANQIFRVSKIGVISPATISVQGTAFNTSITSWQYSTNGGATFVSSLTGVSQSGNTVTITGSSMTTNSITIKASDGTYSDMFTVYKVYDGTDGKQGSDGNPAPIVFLTNENISFSADSQGRIASTTVTSNIVGYNGTDKVLPIISDITGLPSGMSITTSTVDVSNELMLTIVIDNNATLGSSLSNRGTINIPVLSPASTVLSLNWSKINAGTEASLVTINPSALYFKSTTGKDGTFTPDYIYLYPRFQNVTYAGWQYSADGGGTWASVSGANGLLIVSHNSIGNTLRISRTSTLYTDDVTSISFRCNSLTSGVYDTVSIAKIYDVVDLQIGGRNLVLASNTPISSTLYPVATYQMSEDWELGVTYTIAIKGSINSGQKFGIWANGSASRVATLDYDTTKGIHIATFTPTSITTQKPKILNVYNTSSDTATEASIEWIKLEKGNKATADWSPAPEDLKSTTFQLYAPKGHLITNDVPEVTLQTFAYDGSQAITGATFAWYSWNGEVWVAVGGATGTSLTLNKSSVLKSNVYKCVMTYKGKTYEDTATVEDKTDIYDCLINATAKYSPTNRIYWVLYTTVFSEEGERDKLLGPVDVVAPENPTTGAYWYKVDETNYTATLMKYSGTAWTTTTDKQEFMYDWFLFNDTTDIVSLGVQSKVKIVTSNDFSRVCSVQCNVSDSALVPMTHNNQMLTDPSDPVVSSTEPINPINGQLWIKTGANGIYTLLVWDASLEQWIVSEADSQVKVHISKPTSYEVGDVWVVGSDYEPIVYVNGVAQTTKHFAGTMLKAQYSSQTYKDSDWVEALNYKRAIDELKENLNVYNQYFTFDETGMTMRAKNLSGQISEFSTKLTNNELGFYQGENKVAYINNNQLNISKAEITNGMTIGGTAPILEIGNFAIIQESNGSLSIGLKS